MRCLSLISTLGFIWPYDCPVLLHEKGLSATIQATGRKQNMAVMLSDLRSIKQWGHYNERFND
jgi:hypothetical protein